MIGIDKNYILKVKFGDIVIPLDPSIINSCIIVQDINRFLPEFRLSIIDQQGMLTNAVPFDSRMSRISIELSTEIDSSNIFTYNFTVFKRTPRTNGVVNDYDIRGLLTVKNLFDQKYSRSFKQPVKDTIQFIADEMGVDSTSISSFLGDYKLLVQADWTNSVFLNYLKENLDGVSGVGNFRCFVTIKQNKTQFVFKSVDELVRGTIKKKFVVANEKYEDYEPIYKYEIMDNYKIMGVEGCYQQPSVYFNYDSGSWVNDSMNVDSLTSLSEYILVDGNDDLNGRIMPDVGRTTAFTKDFHGTIKSDFETRVCDLVKMWITGNGQIDVNPGDVVRVLFPHGTESGNLFSYQYSGNWLVERVVHSFDDMFRSKFLLTRHGLDTDKKTTLYRAKSVRK